MTSAKPRAWPALWTDRALALRLLALLTARDVAHVMHVDRTCRTCIQRQLTRFRRASARLGFSLWCRQHVVLEFQSYYQELETHSIARSVVHDPRVPPRVVSLWAERGKVPNGVVTLRAEPVPKRTERGVTLRFVTTADQKPMLTSVVQHQRRIYTVVTLKISTNSHRRGGQEQEQEQEQESIVLRRFGYLKEFGEWRGMVSASEKRRFDAHGALCRYDLVSLDGSVALELDVPRGADSMMDYYLVKRATVVLPINELLHPFVKRIRPMRPLAAAAPAAASGNLVVQRCVVVLSFGRLDGTIDATHRLVAELTVEQQQREPSQSNTNAGASAPSEEVPVSATPVPRPRTGIESFDIVTIKRSVPAHVELPRTPGYVWMTILDDETPVTSTPLARRPFYYSTAMLHSGATRDRATLTIDAQWVPGTLESFPTPQSRHRRPLKGFFHLSVDMETSQVHELSIVAQHLPVERLEPYAASMESYTRPLAL